MTTQTTRAGLGACTGCGKQYPIRAGGKVAAHGQCPGGGQPPEQPVPCTRCGRTGLALTRGRCAVCRTGTGGDGQEWRQPSEDPAKVVLLRVRLRDQPGAQAYYLARLGLAERLVNDAADSGDQVEILSRRSFAVAAAVPDSAVRPNKLHPLGTQVGGVWVPSKAASAAQQRN